ncbi:hypothetical protein ABIB66_008048 [Bradyrhizobium sp. F1.13.3]
MQQANSEPREFFVPEEDLAKTGEHVTILLAQPRLIASCRYGFNVLLLLRPSDFARCLRAISSTM